MNDDTLAAPIKKVLRTASAHPQFFRFDYEG